MEDKAYTYETRDRIVEGKALLISDRIEGVVPAESVPEGIEKTDCGGGYIAPGLIDIHIHGYLGKDVCDGTEDSIFTIANGLLANGVTGFRPTTMTVAMAWKAYPRFFPPVFAISRQGWRMGFRASRNVGIGLPMSRSTMMVFRPA